MARCYSGWMRNCHCLPDIWVISDERNDARLEAVLNRLPRGSGLIFRHYHLTENERRVRFETLRRACRKRGHWIVLSGTARQARTWRADGAYGDPQKLAHGPETLRLVTAHSLREIGQAQRARADAILLSPVFPTRSHPRAKNLGPVRFRLLAKHAKVIVFALGGMNEHRARAMEWKNWAAIDGT